MADPKIGEMVLYDYIRPALLDGSYRMRVGTDVTVSGHEQPLDGQDFFFNVEGPRFSLAPTEVAGMYPPRNGHGSFDGALPHVALGRRTLPWERALAGAYTAPAGQSPYPFLALVLFQKDECTIKHDMKLEDVVPADVFKRLGRPAGIHCDAVEADAALVKAILPMPEELQLLTHVRQVNVDDRELAAGDSDGYFAVVTANRIPQDGNDYVACLVSVEERTDLLPTTDPPAPPESMISVVGLDADVADVQAAAPSHLGTTIAAADADRVIRPGLAQAMSRDVFVPPLQLPVVVEAGDKESLDIRTAASRAQSSALNIKRGGLVLHPPARLVLLHSWTFACAGAGTFRERMQALDVGMIGDVDPARKLAVTDTGHIKIDVIDRLGAPEQSWYRGPLVGQPLTRDPLGPYHSADQCRRVVADTGAENISYASAFEVGRLLAAADGRLAQELMRWRRGAFSSSTLQTALDLLASRMRLTALVDPLDPIALRYAVNVLDKIANGVGPLGDPLYAQAVLDSPLLQPAAIAQAFGLADASAAVQLLGDPALTQPVAPPAAVTPLTTLQQVLADGAGAAALSMVRQQAVTNATLRNEAAGGQGGENPRPRHASRCTTGSRRPTSRPRC